MSAIPATLLAAIEAGEFSGCFMMNGQWHGTRAFPCDEQPQDNYAKMPVWELANLSKRRGLSYTQPNKKAFIEKLREQDASGSVPTLRVWQPRTSDGLIEFERLNWCELYEICHMFKVPLTNVGKRWRKSALIEELRKHEATCSVPRAEIFPHRGTLDFDRLNWVELNAACNVYKLPFRPFGLDCCYKRNRQAIIEELHKAETEKHVAAELAL
jgi:hypothetical protein